MRRDPLIVLPGVRPAMALVALAPLVACGAEEAGVPLLQPPSREGWDPQGPWPGFTLLTPLQSRRVYLVDMAGNPVHTWDTAAKPGLAVVLTERGTLLKAHRLEDDEDSAFARAGGEGGWFQELDWDGRVLWDFRWAGEHGRAHHDFVELPGGNLLFLAWERTTREVALAAGRDPELLPGEEFWPGTVIEVEPTRPSGGRVVWTWRALDHLVQQRDASAPNFGNPAEHPWRIHVDGDRDAQLPTEQEADDTAAHMAAIGYAGGDPDGGADEDAPDPEDEARRARVRGADWMHANGLDHNPQLDQIAISVRYFDEVWILDHGLSTEEAAGPAGDLLYRWGNPSAHGMGRWEDRRLFGQHDVQWIPPGHLGAGNLLVFNNGAFTRGYSSVDEWWPPRDAQGRYPRRADAPWEPSELEWTYVHPAPEDLYSPFISGAQRLPNGNTLICSGEQGWVFEVTPAGRVVWDWRSPFGPDPDEREEDNTDLPTAMFRAERYAPDHPGIVALRAKGVPVPLDPGVGPATNQAVPLPDEER